jgi:hypothetical protein
MLVGGVLHPQIPSRLEDQKVAIAASGPWVPAHWTLTLGQAAALVGIAVVAAGARQRPSALHVGGAAALLAGLGFGALGTLLAATALKTAAMGDAANFAVWSDGTMGVGWLALLLSAAGGAAWGLEMVRRPGLLPKPWGVVLLAGSLALLAAAVAVPYDHWWTHQYVLRVGALSLGVGLLGLAAGWLKAPWATPSAAP